MTNTDTTNIFQKFSPADLANLAQYTLPSSEARREVQAEPAGSVAAWVKEPGGFYDSLAHLITKRLHHETYLLATSPGQDLLLVCYGKDYEKPWLCIDNGDRFCSTAEAKHFEACGLTAPELLEKLQIVAQIVAGVREVPDLTRKNQLYNSIRRTNYIDLRKPEVFDLLTGLSSTPGRTGEATPQ